MKRKLFGRRGGGGKHGEPKAMNIEELRLMVQAIFTTSEDEIDCEDCFQELDAFAEKELAGKDVASALPLLEDHLNRCRDCREEYELLLKALKAQLKN